VSGMDVPMATKVIAVTPGFIIITHPIKLATWATIRVHRPMKTRAITKAGKPPP
jgi:hypothetical protein